MDMIVQVVQQSGGLRVRYQRPGSPSFSGVLVGSSPVSLNVLFVRRDMDNQVVACDGEYLVEDKAQAEQEVAAAEILRSNWIARNGCDAEYDPYACL